MKFILLVLALISVSNQLGVSLHILLASRSNIPEELPLEYILGGAFYPDCFYNCLGLSSVGEYDHWTPFLYEMVKYYDELLQEDLNFKLFIYGVLSHQIADVTWHSIRLHQGMLKYLNNVEFANDEDFTKSHTFIDTGGDFVLLDKLLANLSKDDREKTLGFFKKTWGLPIDHLLNVYQRLGYHQINEQNLKYCMLRGYSALQLEVSAMSLEFNNPSTYYKEKSPLFVDILDTYYLGGLQEILYTLDKCLPNLDYWFKNIDKIKDSRTICNTFAGSNVNNNDETSLILPTSLSSKDGILISPYSPGSYFGTSLVVGKFLNDDKDCVAVSAPYEEGVGSVYIFPIDEFEALGTSQHHSIKIHQEGKWTTYPPKFGFKLMKFMDRFLVASMPGLSSLKFFFNGCEILELVSTESNNVIGEYGLKQLGILLELDNNGHDIVVGSKYAEVSGYGEQKGVIFILNGDLILVNLLQNLQSQHSNKLNMNQFLKKRLEIPTPLRQSSNFESFGSQFTSLKNIKAIGVENLGLILIYVDNKSEVVITSDLEVLSYHDENLRQKISKLSSLQTSQFGSNFLKLTLIDDEIYLIISSKSSSQYCSQCGIGYIFKIYDIGANLIAKLSTTSLENFYQFFQNGLLLSNNTLLVGSSSFNDSQGAIWRIELPELVRKYHDGGEILEYTALVLVQLGPSGAGYTGFGEALGYSEQNEKLVVGMPFFGYSCLEDKDRGLIGKLGIY